VENIMKSLARFPRSWPILAAALALSAAPLARAVLVPLPVTGFNQDIVVEATAVNNPTTHYATNITASMDDGLAKTGDTWYELGLNTTAPTTGLPMNIPLVAQEKSDLTFRLGSAVGNNALFLDTTNPNGTLTLSTPVKLSKLAIISSSGNGSITGASLGLQFTDLGPSVQTTYDSGDWFFRSSRAVTANGRVNAPAGTLDDVNSDNPRLYFQVIDLAALGASNRELSSINFGFNGAPETHTAIMAISGEAVPEPATLSLVAIASLSLLTRRRR
jgi:hypothetical protein